jgi:hypothetical protein
MDFSLALSCSSSISPSRAYRLELAGLGIDCATCAGFVGGFIGFVDDAMASAGVASPPIFDLQ